MVIALDGFQESSFQFTPFLSKFRSGGVSTMNLNTLEKLSNALNTFHSVATGFTTQKHGVIGHDFCGNSKGCSGNKYSEQLYKFRSNKYVDNKNTGKKGPVVIPIWTLNEIKNGISGCMMWPGSEFYYANDIKPTFYEVLNKETPLGERLDTVKGWFDNKASPNLVMIYIEEPDKTMHRNGVNHEKNAEMFTKLDEALRKFIEDDLSDITGLKQRLNIVFLSDHGISNVELKDMLNIESEIYNNECRSESLKYPVEGTAFVFSDPGSTGKCPVRNDSWTYIYYTEDETCRDRTGSWIFIPPRPKAILKAMQPYIDERTENEALGEEPLPNTTTFGVHGWVNDKTNWKYQAIFMAQGPAFVTGIAKPFKMYDFYSLFAKVLRIKGHFDNDGHFSNVKPLLKIRYAHSINWNYRFLIILSCAIMHCTAIYFYGNAKIKAIEKEKKERAAQRKQKQKLSFQKNRSSTELNNYSETILNRNDLNEE